MSAVTRSSPATSEKISCHRSSETFGWSAPFEGTLHTDSSGLTICSCQRSDASYGLLAHPRSMLWWEGWAMWLRFEWPWIGETIGNWSTPPSRSQTRPPFQSSSVHLCCTHTGSAPSCPTQLGSVLARISSSADLCQVGGADIIGRIVEDLKDASEPYRKMVMETIDKAIRGWRPLQSLVLIGAVSQPPVEV